VDRLDQLACGTQFLLEGVGTTCLMLQNYVSEEDSLRCAQGAFIIALLGMFVPIFEKGYESLIVQIIKMTQKDDFSWQSCLCAFFVFLTTLPSVILALVGISLGEAGIMDAVMEEALGSGEAAVDEILEGLADAGSNLYFTHFAPRRIARACTKHIKRKRAAATRIQAITRRRRVQRRWLRQRAASVRVQSAYRRHSQQWSDVSDDLLAANSLSRRSSDDVGSSRGPPSPAPVQDSRSQTMSWLDQQLRDAEQKGKKKSKFSDQDMRSDR